jgi:hypothetical protein
MKPGLIPFRGTEKSNRRRSELAPRIEAFPDGVVVEHTEVLAAGPGKVNGRDKSGEPLGLAAAPMGLKPKP